jgi:hypothetical protein
MQKEGKLNMKYLITMMWVIFLFLPTAMGGADIVQNAGTTTTENNDISVMAGNSYVAAGSVDSITQTVTEEDFEKPNRSQILYTIVSI